MVKTPIKFPDPRRDHQNLITCRTVVLRISSKNRQLFSYSANRQTKREKTYGNIRVGEDE